jgi:hypothetical protein
MEFEPYEWLSSEIVADAEYGLVGGGLEIEKCSSIEDYPLPGGRAVRRYCQ